MLFLLSFEVMVYDIKWCGCRSALYTLKSHHSLLCRSCDRIVSQNRANVLIQLITCSSLSGDFQNNLKVFIKNVYEHSLKSQVLPQAYRVLSTASCCCHLQLFQLLHSIPLLLFLDYSVLIDFLLRNRIISFFFTSASLQTMDTYFHSYMLPWSFSFPYK